MSETIAAIYQPLESVLSALGLNTPTRRFIATTLGAASVEFFVRPWYAFNSDGSIKNWVFIDPDKGTYIPAGLIPVVVGLGSALFI